MNTPVSAQSPRLKNGYLSKHAFCERQVKPNPRAGTATIVVIPCYREPDLLNTLKSLFDCHDTVRPAEVLVVINSGDSDSEDILIKNRRTFDEASGWIAANPKENLKFYLIDAKNLPGKHAGVGLARKIGMDEAVRRFEEARNPNGVIVCLDADCTVDANFLVAVESHFEKNKRTTGCGIYFEHPLEGNMEPSIYDAITGYELFLRYYKAALRFCGFPHPFHTVGSSMAVRSHVYQKQGGMNRRKAGEDFYFLHKVFSLGNFSELNTTRVIPSARASDRVPFGTGASVTKILAGRQSVYPVYHIQTFKDLRLLFNAVPGMWSPGRHDTPFVNTLPASLTAFLSLNGFAGKLAEIRGNSASAPAFHQRFFGWFDGFMVLKFAHFARDRFYAPMPILEAATAMAEMVGRQAGLSLSRRELLLLYREMDKQAVAAK